MITVNEIQVIKGQKTILDGISFKAKKGEILAIAGANGSGKSTLLNCLSGFEIPQRGKVLFNNRLLQNYTHSELAKYRSHLNQETHIPYSISCLETVVMGRFPYIKEESSSQSYTIAEQTLTHLGIEQFKDRDITTLSGGERQKIHFARVLSQLTSTDFKTSKFLLLDEPLKGLDLAQQYFLLSKIKEEVAQNKMGVIMVLHDLNLIAQFADRVILLSNQQILKIGKPHEVFTSDSIFNAFNIKISVNIHPEFNYPIITALPYNHLSKCLN